MHYQNRTRTSDLFSFIIVVAIVLTLFILTTITVLAAPAGDHLEVCNVSFPSRLVGSTQFPDLGADFDARLEIELESARCAAAELEQSLVLISDLLSTDELIFEGSLGLDQDLRLREELSDARDVVASFSARQPSEERMLRSLVAQESRDARMLSGFVSEFSQGSDQDLRLGSELAAAREVVSMINGRFASDTQLLRSLSAQEAREASILSEFGFDLNLGVLQDLRLGAEISASRVAAVALSAR